jgi:hypothetical protein
VAEAGKPAVNSPICFWRSNVEGATLVVIGCGGFRARSDPTAAVVS